jgi:hypothetical protein
VINPLDDLLVAIPVSELSYTMFWQKLCANRDFGYLVSQGRLMTIAGAYVHGSHNAMTKEALGDKVPPWKRLLWLEYDHEFPEDVFRRHAAYKEPVVSGLYCLRNIAEPLPVFYNWDAARHNALHLDAARVAEMLEKRGLYEVDVVPMGCTSVRRDVLEQWPSDQPFYSSFTNPRGATMSDDVWFCRIAQDAGWSIYIDTSLRVKHITQVPIDDSYFISWWNQIGSKRAIEAVEKTA